MSSLSDFEKHANAWWTKHFDSKEIPVADLCKALRANETFCSGDESERDVSILIKEVIGVKEGFGVTQQEGIGVIQPKQLVNQKDFCHFAKRCGPLEKIVKRSVQSFIVHGDIVPWFHGCISRKISKDRLKRAMSWENIKRKIEG